MSTPSAWETAWASAQPAISTIQTSLGQSSSPDPRIIRVGQLDSELLDQELSSLLQEPINRALPLISNTLKSRFEPELAFLIQLVLYKFSVWDTGASYGAKLQDLRYVAAKQQGSTLGSRIPRRTLLAHGALTLLLPYLRERLRSHALSNAWPDAPSSDRRRKAWDLLDNLETTHTLLGLLNFTMFLWNGRYRTLADRLLRMRLVPCRRQVKRDVSYEFMNRQMVWHAFTEFLLFLLPLIDAKTVRKRVYRLGGWLSPQSLLTLLPEKPLARLGITLSQQSSASLKKQGKYANLAENECAICLENASFNLNPSDPSNAFTTIAATPVHSDNPDAQDDVPSHPIHIPYITSCGHLYCYYCLAERMVQVADGEDEERAWECLRCGEEVKQADRYSVEVPEVDDLDVSGSEYEFSSDLDMYTDMSGSMGSYSESALSE
ncbi:peroxisomal biogenesis factor 2 [Ephemerocybe angulata]|uniref:RING-type E3 ubiquitin transferase (cysteine targeting) n=1 Tax=Ephemerocybe angulata TaxID=980116 RepID=A0A8H6MAU6_9AGAR|nr:peroxisomal biogenesis factor 2 [Tulosesus angulatus]